MVKCEEIMDRSKIGRSSSNYLGVVFSKNSVFSILMSQPFGKGNKTVGS